MAEPIKLTPIAVTSIVADCLYTAIEADPGGQQPKDAVVVEGIVTGYGFHPGRLQEHRQEILELLHQLPWQFRQDKDVGGGGWSFLNACYDNDGEQWTGEHRVMEQLFCLGMAIGAVTCPFHREMWDVLPGNVPYYVITEEPEPEVDVPEHCDVCDEPPTMGLDGTAYCNAHAPDGWAAIGRQRALAKGVTNEQELLAAERAMRFACRQAIERDDMEVGETMHIDARGHDS